MERAIICPQCNAPLRPHRFARSVVCSYCGTTVQLDEDSVSAALFHDAYNRWNSAQTYGIPSWSSIKDNHWELDECIAHGDISDVYIGRRARWPTQLVIIKLLRELRDLDLFNNEWDILQTLQASEANGADAFTALIPQPILHGPITGGSHIGKQTSIFHWSNGFYYTFEEVREAYPQGVPPRASIWIWRRILEILSFIHSSGLVHGAVLPSHLIIQENEHGVRLVGYSNAGHPGEKLRSVFSKFQAFYPEKLQSASVLSIAVDLSMSARCVAAMLGGNPRNATVPDSVPASLASLIRRIAFLDPSAKLQEGAWALRDELGNIANKEFGSPKFVPILMPSRV